jgi:hypothetical protein
MPPPDELEKRIVATARMMRDFRKRNLECHDLTNVQKAMLVAVRFPDAPKGGRGQKALETSGFPRQRVGQARAVVALCPEMADQVIAGKMGLDEAYKEAQRRRTSVESRGVQQWRMTDGRILERFLGAILYLHR